MFIFELQDNIVKMSSKLVGSILTTKPEQYIYFLDYWEYQRLTLQIRRLHNNPDAIVEDELYKMVASSFAISEQRYLVYCLFDTPYCVMWMPAAFDSGYVMQVVNTTIQLAGGILEAKKRGINN